MNGRTQQQGFVLAAVLILSGLAALMVLDALTGAALAHATVTRLQLRQEAFEAAEGALAAQTLRIATGAAPPGEDGPARFVVQTTARMHTTEAAPDGYSAGRFRLEHFDLEAAVSGPRGTQLVLQSGLARWNTGP